MSRPGHRVRGAYRPMNGRDVLVMCAVGIVACFVGLAAVYYAMAVVWDATHSYLALLGLLLAFYAGIHWIVEPFRPSWAPSLFGDRVNDWRRARYERRRARRRVAS